MKLKIAIAASGGGHFTEVMQLSSVWKNNPHFFVCDERPNTKSLQGKETVYFVTCPRRNPFRLISNLIQVIRVFFKEKPDIVITTGADTAVPFCIMSKLMGKKVIFVESLARTKELSMSGKIMKHFSDEFFIQWKENQPFFTKATYAGSVIE